MNYNRYSTKIKSFNELNGFDFIATKTKAITQEIENKGKEYILGVDEHEFKNYLKDKYSLEPLMIDYESEHFDMPAISKEIKEDPFYREKYEVEVYVFTIKYRFLGSGILFSIHPFTFTMTSTEISVNEHQNIVSFDFKLFKKDPQEFEREKNSIKNRAFINLENANQYANSFNQEISNFIQNEFLSQKSKFLAENDFFAAINIKVNPDTVSVFTAPGLQKKIIPQPKVPNNTEYSTAPAMSKEMYDDILKVIYDSGKSMEKKPALYKGKDEEGLRDQFVYVLETRYEATTASGETFNKGGKTDIILKYAPDASNIFVAECKFWHGASEFLKAISQLFDRYLTWRDSKVALILFVTNKEFSSVLETIKIEATKHPYFKKIKGERGESSFSYIYCLPQDKEKQVYLEIMAFHYDQ